MLGLALGGQGLRIDRVELLDGVSLPLEVTVTDAALRRRLSEPLDWQVQLPPPARAEVSSATLLPAPRTVLAVDQSGSFKPYTKQAWDLASSYVKASLPGERVGLMTFGLKATHYPTRERPRGTLNQIKLARQQPPNQQETRLGEFIRQAIDRAANEAPPSEGGQRKVLIFTDGGEESNAWKLDDLVAHALARHTRVYVVVFYKHSHGKLANRLDMLSRLSAQTHGQMIQVESSVQARRALSEVVADGAATVRIQADLCGVTQASPALSVSVRADGERLGWTQPVATPLALTAAASQPCRPVATADALPTTPVSPSRPSPTVTSHKGWRWGLICPALSLLVLVGIGLLILLWVLSWRRRADANEVDTQQGSASPSPSVGSASAPAAVSNTPQVLAAPVPPPAPATNTDSTAFSDHLPETHLVVERGVGGVGRRWRFTGRILRLGALADEGNDVVLDNSEISGHHARFELYRSGDIYVTDLHSSNGTWLEGRQLEPGERVQVHHGQRVALSGSLVLRVEQRSQS